MWIFTTAGFISITAQPDSDIRHVVAYDTDSFQTFLDGIEMVAGIEPTILNGADIAGYLVLRAAVPADALAEWLAQEVREYTPLEPLEDAVRASRGPGWATALGIGLDALTDHLRAERLGDGQ